MSENAREGTFAAWLHRSTIYASWAFVRVRKRADFVGDREGEGQFLAERYLHFAQNF